MKATILGFIPTIICLLAITIYYKRLQPKWLQLFLYLLLFTLAIEIGAALYSGYYKKSNHFIINIYLPISYAFYFFIFLKNLGTGKYASVIYTAFTVYVLCFLYDIIFIDGLFYFNTYSYCLGSILIVLCCLLYFMHLFKSDILLNYFALPMFWISTGLLFFYAGSLVEMSLIRYMINNHLDPDSSIYDIIMLILNVLLYGSFTMSFLCNIKWQKHR